MRRTTQRRATGVALAVLVAAGAGAALAGDEDPAGVSLRADLPGGEAELELEDRNAEPAVCFLWRSDPFQDGDTTASRILDRSGRLVLDLGVGDQAVEDSVSGCEIPLTARYREVFARPGDHVVEVRVVEQAGPGDGGRVLRSGPLDRD